MNIGFVSTRFSGADGVTLETSKWAQVFQRNGHTTFWFAGELDRDPSVSYLAPEAHFLHPDNAAVNDAIVGQPKRCARDTERIHALRVQLKTHLYRFLRRYGIDLLVAENVLSLPMHVPLGLALTEVIAETDIPTIAHHHDFTWERDRYLVHAAGDFLSMAFPPKLPGVAHMVINAAAREELARRTGIAATVVPNVMDFSTPPAVDWDAVASFKAYAGIEPGDIVVLQPTRIIQRKGIEHAVNLVRSLGRPNSKLILSHPAGDEGQAYPRWIQDYARSQGVALICVDARIDDPWGTHVRKHPQFSLYEIYPCADIVTFPSLCEGFGNALLEAIYFGKPILVNRYGTFIRDIEPLGFQMAAIDGFLTDEAVQQVMDWIDHPQRCEAATNRNYRIASRHFSYPCLQQRLNQAMTQFNCDRLPRMEAVDPPAAPHMAPAGQRSSAPTPGEVQWAKAYN